MSLPPSAPTRHLAAVWFADLVGYSRLSAEDEPAALRLVRLFQEVTREEVARFGGRVVKFIGDAALAEFGSTEAAVRAALALQQQFNARCSSAGLKSRLRVGIHVGDVTSSPDGDVYGDGVNIAARLQKEAAPDQVLVSEDVWRQLRQRPEYQFAALGERELRGITARVAVFDVHLDAGQHSAPSAPLTDTWANSASANSKSGAALTRPSGAPAGASWRKKRVLVGVAGALTLALLAVGLFAGGFFSGSPWPGDARLNAVTSESESAAIHSIAVLPFVNMSADGENEYFSDGLTEELLNVLAQIDGLRVAARTSSFAFKGVNQGVSEIGRTLNVQTVLEGSVRKAGNRVRITAQLINVADGYHLWSQTYDRELADIFVVQDEISRAIVSHLLPRFASVPVGVQHGSTADVEAYEEYLKGRYAFWQGSGAENLRTAIRHYEAALQRDPDYALAWAGLSDAYMLLGGQHAPPREVFPQAKEAALRAIELDDQLAEGYVALASINWFYDWDWRAAEQNYRRSFSVNRAVYTRCICYVWYLAVLGDHEAAVREGERARSLDPVAHLPLTTLARMYHLAGRYDDTRATLRAMEELGSTSPLIPRMKAWLHWEAGRRNEALTEMDALRARLDERGGFAATAPAEAVAELTYMYAQTGRRAEAVQLAQALRERAEQRYVPQEHVAAAFAAIGDVPEASRWLDLAYANRSNLGMFSAYPVARALRDVPRYQEVLQQIGLPARTR